MQGYWSNHKLKSILAIFFIVVSGVIFHKAIKYEETAYDTGTHKKSVDAVAFFFKAKADCKKETTEAERYSCYKAVDEVFERHISIRDLGSQDTMAKATRGLLWIGAFQAVAAIATVFLLMWTVRQTTGILGQSRQATKAAADTLDQANKTTKLTRETLAATKEASAAQLIEASKTTAAAIRAADAAEGAERAHILVDFEIDPLPNSHGNYVLEARVVNAGKTPAINIICHYSWNVQGKACIGMQLPIAILKAGAEEMLEVEAFAKNLELSPTDSLATLNVIVESYEDIFGGKYGGVTANAKLNNSMALDTSITLPKEKKGD